MPRFDFKCPACGSITTERFGSAIEADSANLYCGPCQTDIDQNHRLVRQWSAPNFTIKGYNASNGYAKKE